MPRAGPEDWARWALWGRTGLWVRVLEVIVCGAELVDPGCRPTSWSTQVACRVDSRDVNRLPRVGVRQSPPSCPLSVPYLRALGSKVILNSRVILYSSVILNA